jgi:hypothetical protein
MNPIVEWGEVQFAQIKHYNFLNDEILQLQRFHNIA